MGINGNVKGTPQLPQIDGSASTGPGTQVFINPFSGEEEIRQADYIVFGRPAEEDTLKNDTTESKNDYAVNLTGVDMNLLFN